MVSCGLSPYLGQLDMCLCFKVRGYVGWSFSSAYMPRSLKILFDGEYFIFTVGVQAQSGERWKSNLI